MLSLLLIFLFLGNNPCLSGKRVSQRPCGNVVKGNSKIWKDSYVSVVMEASYPLVPCCRKALELFKVLSKFGGDFERKKW